VSILVANIDNIALDIYGVNIVSGASKSDSILLIYIQIYRYFKPWCIMFD